MSMLKIALLQIAPRNSFVLFDRYGELKFVLQKYIPAILM